LLEWQLQVDFGRVASKPISSHVSGQQPAAPCDDEVTGEAKQQPESNH